MKKYNVAIISRGGYEHIDTLTADDGTKTTVKVNKFAIEVKLNGAIETAFTKRDPKDHSGASITVFEKGDVIPWSDADEKFDSQFIVVNGYNDANTFKQGAEYEKERDAFFAEA